MASGTTMTDQEIVAYIVKAWSDMANVGVDEATIEAGLAYVKASGIHAWTELLRDHPSAVAFRAHREALGMSVATPTPAGPTPAWLTSIWQGISRAEVILTSLAALIPQLQAGSGNLSHLTADQISAAAVGVFTAFEAIKDGWNKRTT